VQNRFVVVAGAALCAVVGIAGCSSSPKNSPQPPGSLPPATAQVTVNGQSTGPTRELRCTQDGWTHTIKTGDEKSGVTAVIDTGGAINAMSVVITNVNEFTGSVWENKIGKAEAAMIGTTFRVNGTAQGSTADNPNKQTTASFEIKANC
jgi:hypothetical protein